ncbi:MAG: sigma 54-dependent Fis family transcriptional regulator [Deltaproteobacteria bacterium]|nr:sigma 54-dependent Fis family transcriptional regulator [Deltaproteobacteria bacterium]
MSRMRVRAIHLEVVRGPDRGAVFDSQRERVAIGTAPGNDLVLTDPTVSRYHLELERQANRIVVRDLGSTNGTAIGPVLLENQSASLAAGAVLDLGQTGLQLGDGGVVLLELGVGDTLHDIRGRSTEMKRLMATVQRLAEKDVAVMVLGESGTGKELIARAMHQCGPRASQPLVTIDCGALAPALFASELFGHERGAFTGADRRYQGAFERAHGGTLFLDEVGELSAEHQVALLGALERRRIRRVGGQEEIPVDVRVISATHRDLRAQVNAGAFRLDLYYRLAVVLLAIPPLCKHAADIPLLIEHFLRESGFTGPVAEVFSEKEMSELQSHSWPGNVRELRNLVEARLAVGREVRVTPAATAMRDRGLDGSDLVASVLDRGYREARGAVLNEFEQRYLTHLLERSGGNVRQAARVAGMDRSYLIDLLRRHELP